MKRAPGRHAARLGLAISLMAGEAASLARAGCPCYPTALNLDPAVD